MANFTYTALTKDGKSVSGTLEAKDRESVNQLLSKQGYRPLLIKEARSTKGGINLSFGKKVKLKDLVIFTRQLSTMVNAGIPLSRSMATLQSQTSNKFFKTELAVIAKDLESGLSFADALEKHPDVFSPIYINMVRAGEAGGILDDILKKLALQQEKDAAIKAKIKSASTYPVILTVIMALAFFGLTIFVIPKIGKMLKSLGGEDAKLPPQTEFMLAMSNFMTQKWPFILAVAIGGSIFFNRWKKTKKGRQTIDAVLLKTPVLKVVITKVAIARFARIFASLMGAGVSVLETLEVTSKAIGNTVIEKELMHAASEVRNGRQLSEPISESKLFPPIVSQMLAVGEETGQTETILIKVADFYEEEVDALVDGLSSIIEPIMICVMGAMVGLIAASVIGPISSLAQNVGQGG